MDDRGSCRRAAGGYDPNYLRYASVRVPVPAGMSEELARFSASYDQLTQEASELEAAAWVAGMTLDAMLAPTANHPCRVQGIVSSYARACCVVKAVLQDLIDHARHEYRWADSVYLLVADRARQRSVDWSEVVRPLRAGDAPTAVAMAAVVALREAAATRAAATEIAATVVPHQWRDRVLAAVGVCEDRGRELVLAEEWWARVDAARDAAIQAAPLGAIALYAGTDPAMNALVQEYELANRVRSLANANVGTARATLRSVVEEQCDFDAGVGDDPAAWLTMAAAVVHGVKSTGNVSG